MVARQAPIQGGDGMKQSVHTLVKQIHTSRKQRACVIVYEVLNVQGFHYLQSVPELFPCGYIGQKVCPLSLAIRPTLPFPVPWFSFQHPIPASPSWPPLDSSRTEAVTYFLVLCPGPIRPSHV